jgi:uncharacterized protein (DUF1778 family)
LTIHVQRGHAGAGVRTQTTLRLSAEETARLDAAARRLHLDRASFIRATALGAAELVLESAPPLVLAVAPAALLRQAAVHLAAPPPARAAAQQRRRSR